MPDLPDLQTLRLCSALASMAFALVYMTLWFGRRDEEHLLYWAGSSLLYVLVLVGFAWSSHSALADGALYGVLAFTNMLVLAGVRRFDGRAAFAGWMAFPVLTAALGYGLPAWSLGPDAASARIGGTLGLASSMAVAGIAVGFARHGRPSSGRRIASLALLGYLPGYAAAFVSEANGWSPVNMAALLPMLSDQLLLSVLNLGLLAMPGERAAAALREAALRDSMTGAWNRAGLDALTPRMLAAGSSVIVIDVDHFKAINDAHGHAVGDGVLKELVGGARGVLPPDAAIVRLGGDEFAVILPRTGMTAARRHAEAIRVATRLRPDLPAWTVSLGIAVVSHGDASFAEALARADASLYNAKAQGRDRAAAA